MKYTSTHKIIFVAVVVATFALYAATTYRSVPLWESGEYYTAVESGAIPFPPASPLFQIMSSALSNLAFVASFAWKYNIVNALFAAIASGLIYLVGCRSVFSALRGREQPETMLLIHMSGIFSAAVLAFSSTFWGASQHFQPLMLAAALSLFIIWLGFLMYDSEADETAVRMLLLIVFALGLGVGLHWSVMYAIVPVFFLWYFRNYYFSAGGFLLFLVLSSAIYLIFFKGSTWIIPRVSAALFGISPGWFGVAVVTSLLALVFVFLARVTSNQAALGSMRLACIAAAMYLVGYSIILVVPTQSELSPLSNYGELNDAQDLAAYVEMQKPGEQVPLFDRMWNSDPRAQASYARYNDAAHYVTAFQIEHMFLRYLFWNFVGKSGDEVHAPAIIDTQEEGPISGRWSRYINSYPQYYFAIPFLIGLIGLIRIFVSKPAVAVVLFVSFVMFGFWMLAALNVSEPIGREIEYSFLVAIAVFAVWIGVGAAAIVSWIVNLASNAETFDTPAFRLGAGAVLMTALFVAAPLKMLSENYSAYESNDNFIAQDFAYNLLQSCEANAVLFTEGDNDTYPLEYLQQVEGIRQDVCVVNLSLLNASWYSKQIAKKLEYGDLGLQLIYDEADIEFLSGASKSALRETAWRTDEMLLQFQVPQQVFAEFNAMLPKGARSHRRGSGKREMAFVSYADYPFELESMPGTVLYFRPWKDIMLEEIIRANNWSRPLYFSVTCSDEAFIGMKDFLRLDGLAYQITPIPFSSGDYVNYSSLIEHLLYPESRYHSDPKPGFMLRSYKPMHFPDGKVVSGFIANYRNAFMQLAKYQINELSSPEGAIASLKAMKKSIPEKVFPLGFSYIFDLGLLYKEAGATWMYNRMMERVERDCLDEIRRNPLAVRSIYSPYRYLFELYQTQGRPEKARGILDTMLKYVPEALDVKQRREELDSLLANQ
jgi:transmembrane protein TMEM260 (protein O-mannosyltransferase)